MRTYRAYCTYVRTYLLIAWISKKRTVGDSDVRDVRTCVYARTHVRLSLCIARFSMKRTVGSGGTYCMYCMYCMCVFTHSMGFYEFINRSDL